MSISLDSLTPDNLGVFEKINKVSLPYDYNHQWYADSLKENNGNLTRIAYFNGIPVGCIKAKLITKPKQSAPSYAQIDTVAVLPKYRHLGIGKKLIDWVVEQCKDKYFLHQVRTHSHSHNFQFYLKLGFKELETIKDHFAKFDPVNPTGKVFAVNF